MSLETLLGLMREELGRLHPKYGLNFKRGHSEAWIRCPSKEHLTRNDGQLEKTPSCRINLSITTKIPLGFTKCFGCSFKGGWQDMASRTGLRLLDDPSMYYREKPNGDMFNSNLRKRLLEDDDEEVNKLIVPDTASEWPASEPWRNIDGKLIHKIGGLNYYDDWINAPRLFLPVYIYKELVGGIKCNLIPQEKGNYFNTDGPWATTALFPFDYVKRKLKNREKRILCLTEGPRDALNLIQFGLPSVSALGAESMWTRTKAELIEALNPDIVLLAFDPDKAGQNATRLAKHHLKGKTKLLMLDMPTDKKGKKAIDPSDLDKDQVAKIIKVMEARI